MIIQLRFITLQPQTAFLSCLAHSYFGLYNKRAIYSLLLCHNDEQNCHSFLGQMKKCWHLSLFLLLTMIFIVAEGAKGGGGRGSRRGPGRGRLYGSRMPILIPHRNPASANYYEHKDGAKIIKASHFELDYTLGRKITFFCMAKGFPRPEITWFKDGIELYHHKFFQVHEWPIGNDTMKSKMEIDPTTQKDAGYYECQADNQYAVDRRGFRTDYVMITY